MPTLAVLEAGQLEELTPLSDRMLLARQEHTGSTANANGNWQFTICKESDHMAATGLFLVC